MNYWVVLRGVQNTWLMPKKNTENVNEYCTFTCGNVNGAYSRDGRFFHDQIFQCREDDVMILDGVLLNLQELKRKYSVNTLESIASLIGHQDEFFSVFRGPFSGLMYNKSDDVLIAFGNQTGDAPVFYFHKDEILIVSNDFNLVFRLVKDMQIDISFDEQAALYLMTYGYMLDESTLVKEIKRLSPGRYIKATGSEFSIHRYHAFQFIDREMTFDEAVDLVEEGFNKAVKRCFDKDIEYGVNYHLADMSGGLDSRMVCFAAKKLGYKNVTNISYSQSESDEHRFAAWASKHLGNEFYHKQLDDALFLYEVEDIIKLNYGLTYYFGITGGRQFLSSLNAGKFGLEHTGQLGDVVIGNFGNTSSHIPPVRGSSRNSKLIEFEPSDEYYSQYVDNEDFTFENRGFRSVLSTHLTRRHYFYTVSPFIDVDFMELCFAIPMRYRAGHKLYWAWLDKYYPDAASIPSTRKREDTSMKALFHSGQRFVKRISRKISHKLGIAESANRGNHMNPFEYWYETSEELRVFIDDYYKRNITLLETYNQTRTYVEMLYNSSRTVDKLIALSVLGGVKTYFGQ